jgi:hypothetical protein
MKRRIAYALFPEWLARRVAAITRDRLSLSLSRLKFRLFRAVRVI